MIDQLIHIDREIFLAINGWHSAFFDQFFYWYSFKWTWIPFYAFLLYLIIREYRKSWWIVLLAVVVLVTLADQTSVRLFKEVFERLRPCHEPALDGLVHTVRDRCGGTYGFVSSHATNSFSLATFLFLIYPPRFNRLKLILFVWALIMIYSRVYLGVHYPGDVIAGAIWGSLIGLMVGYLCLWALRKRKS